MPSMLNRVDRQYGYLSDSIDVIEDNPVIVLKNGDYLPSVSDINSDENVYISLEDSTSKEYFIVTNAILVGDKKNLYTERAKFGSNKKSWNSSDNIKVYLCRLVSITGQNFQEFPYQNSASQLVSKQMQDSINELDNRLDLFANSILLDAESLSSTLSDLENNKIDNTLLQDTQEPSGLLIDETTIEFYTSPFTHGPAFKISPNGIDYTLYVNGTKYLKTTDSSLLMPDESGIWFIYFNGEGNLSYSSNYDDFLNNVPVALGYWNDTENEWSFVSEERNGITMDWATKKYLIGIEGLRWKNGFDSEHQASNEEPVEDADSNFDINGGSLYSQDIFIDVEDSESSGYFKQNLDNIPFFYYGDSYSILTSENSEGYPFYYDGSNVKYNKLDGETFSLENVEDGKYFCTWVLATKDYTNPIYYHITNSTYDTLDIARDEESSRDLELLNSEYLQVKILYKLIFKYESGWVSEDVPTGVKLVDVTDYRSIPNKLNIGSHAALNDLSFSESSHTGFQKETYHNDNVPDFNHDRIDSNGLGINFRTGDFWMKSFYDTTGSSLYVCMNADPNNAIWTPVLTEYSLSEILNGTDWTLGSVTLSNSLIFGEEGNEIYSKLVDSELTWFYNDDDTKLMSINKDSEFTVYNCAVNLEKDSTLFGLAISDTTGEGGTIFSRESSDNSLLPLNIDSYSIVHDSEDEKNFIILKNNLNPSENTSLAEISFENNYTNMSIEFSQEDDRTAIRVNSNELHLSANTTSGLIEENYYGKLYYDGDSQKLLIQDNLGEWVNLEYGYTTGNVLYVDEKREDIYNENGSYDRPYKSLKTVIDSITEEISDLENPIEISTIEELQKIGNDVNYPMNGNYILTGDIDAIDTTGWNGGNGFSPIGNSSSNRFSGVFDGRGYEISNLHIISSGISAGLFGSTDISTIIRNLKITNSKVSGSITSAILIGYARGKVENCCVIDSTTSPTTDGSFIKGIFIGVSNNCVVENCYVENCTFITSYPYGNGFISSSHNSTIKNCYSKNCNISCDTKVSGFISYNVSSYIENCFSSNTLTCTGIDERYGFCGINTSTINNSYYDSTISGLSDTGKGEPKTTVELKQESTFENWDFSSIWEINEGVSYPTLQEILVQSDYEVLGYLKKVIILLPGNYELTNNLSLPSTVSLVGFEKYSSTVEGNYKLSTKNDENYSTIKNIIFNNSELELNNLVTLDECSGTAKITVNNSVRINDCTFENEDVALEYVEGDTLILDSSKINGYYNSILCSGTSGKLYASDTEFLNNDATSATIYITESTGSAQLFLNNCTINNNGGNLVLEQLTAYDNLPIHNFINNCFSDNDSIAKFYNNKTRIDNWISCEFPEEGNETGTILPKPASEISFDPTGHSFVSTNVQDAIYEAAVINTFGGIDLQGTQSSTFQLNWNTGPMFKVYNNNLLGTADTSGTSKIDFTSRSFYGCLIPNNVVTLDSNSSPSVANGNIFKTPIVANVIQVTSLTGGVNGQKITVMGNQGTNLVSLVDSGSGENSINLIKTPFTPSDTEAITLLKTSHGWIEISRSNYNTINSIVYDSYSMIYIDGQRNDYSLGEDGSYMLPFETIENALNYIDSDLSGVYDGIIKVLYVLPGTYSESSSVTLPDNTYIIGVGNPKLENLTINIPSTKMIFQNLDFENITIDASDSDEYLYFKSCNITDSITVDERPIITRGTIGTVSSIKGVSDEIEDNATEIDCIFIDSTGTVTEMTVQEALDVIADGDVFEKYDEAYKISYDSTGNNLIIENNVQSAIDEIDTVINETINNTNNNIIYLDNKIDNTANYIYDRIEIEADYIESKVDENYTTLDDKIDLEINTLDNKIDLEVNNIEIEMSNIYNRIDTVSNWNEWLDANDFSGPVSNGADPTEIVLSGSLYTSWVLIYPKEVITRSVTKTVLTEYWDGTNAIYADVYWVPATSTNPSDTVKLKLYSECIPVGSILGNDMTEVSTETSLVGETNQLNKTTFGPFIPNGANSLDKEMIFFMLERLDDDTYGSNIYVTGIRLRPEPPI